LLESFTKCQFFFLDISKYLLSFDLNIEGSNMARQEAFLFTQKVSLFSKLSFINIKQVVDLTAVDYLGKKFFNLKNRFSVYYILFSFFKNIRILLNTFWSEKLSVFFYIGCFCVGVLARTRKLGYVWY